MATVAESIGDLEAILAPGWETADRASFYLAYYNLIKDINEDAADQVLLQTLITTYSGFIGGGAILGNAIAKFSDPNDYQIALDEFSFDIVNGLLTGIKDNLERGGDGVLTADEIQALDHGVWVEKGLGEYFPGNFQHLNQDLEVFFSAGTLASAIGGYQLVFGGSIGFEPGDYTGSQYETDSSHSDYTLIWLLDENGNRERIVHLEEHIGIVNFLVPDIVREEPGLALIGLLQIPFAKDFITTLPLVATLINDAAGDAIFTLYGKALESIFTDSELDYGLRERLTKFVGANGEAVDPTYTFGSGFQWEDFPIILRSSGTFDDTDQPHIISAYQDAVINAGGGEDLIFAFDSSTVKGGAESDLIFGKLDANLLGEAGNDILLGAGNTTVSGGLDDDIIFALEDATVSGDEGSDFIIATGYGAVDGGADDDVIVAIDPSLFAGDALQIDGGAGNDWIISLGGRGPQVHGGAGDDNLFVWSFGAEVYGDEGADRFYWAPDILIADAEAEDRLSFFGYTLTGGIAYGGEESQWAHQSFLPFVRYGLNGEGELVVDAFGKQTFVANYQGGPGAAENTLGIYLARIEFAFYQILNERPGLKASPLSELLKAQLKAAGVTHPDDPLVLDLDGDGLEFTGLATSETYFDLDGDGFAERTAWLRPDDGFLALDQNGDGAIADISELFGAPGVSGFAELSALDSDGSGVIDAGDSRFGELLVWRDLNQDGASSAEELFSLADLDIASIDLGSTAINTETPSGNLLRAAVTW